MPHDPIAHAKHTLADYAALCQQAKTPELFLLRLDSFLGGCARDPFVRAVVDGLRREHIEFMKTERDALLAILVRLKDALALAREQDPSINSVKNAEWTAAGVEERLANIDDPLDHPVALRPASPGPVGDVAVRLTCVLAGLPDASPARHGQKSAQSVVRSILEDLEWQQGRTESHRMGHGGSAVAQLRDLVDAVGVAPSKRGAQHRVLRLVSGLHGSALTSPRTSVSDLGRAQELVRTLDVEIRARLGTRATHAAALGRYAWGAMSFRRDHLRDVAEKATGKAEQNLAADAADFLFSQGFDVFTEVSVGSVRFDIVSFGDALLIEAKRYEARDSIRRTVKTGIRQLLDYSAKLRAKQIVADSFLLVYRLGGDRLVLPAEPVQVGTDSLRFQVVDLGLSDSSGSKAQATLAISPDEIVEMATKE